MGKLRYREMKQRAEETTAEEQENELWTQAGLKAGVGNHRAALPPLPADRREGKTSCNIPLFNLYFLQGARTDSFWVCNVPLLANLNQVAGQFFQKGIWERNCFFFFPFWEPELHKK